MEKRGLGIVIAAVVLILVIVVINFSLREEPEPEIEVPTPGEEIEVEEVEGIEEVPPTIETVPYKEVFPLEAKDLIDNNPDLVIIDVSAKYRVGHLPNAISYNLNDGTLDAEIDNLDKQKKYLVYSRSDVEGKKAAQKLSDAGFKEVYMLKGSYGLWIEQGYDFERSFISGLFIWNWF